MENRQRRGILSSKSSKTDRSSQKRALSFLLLQSALDYDIDKFQDYLSQGVNVNARFASPTSFSSKSSQTHSMIYWILKNTTLNAVQKVDLCERFFATHAVTIFISEAREITEMLSQIEFSRIPESLLNPITDNEDAEIKRQSDLHLLHEVKNKIPELKNAVISHAVLDPSFKTKNSRPVSKKILSERAKKTLTPFAIIEKAQQKYNQLRSYAGRNPHYKTDQIIRYSYDLDRTIPLKEKDFSDFCMAIVASSDRLSLQTPNQTSYPDLFAISQRSFEARMNRQSVKNFQDLVYCLIQDDLYGLSQSYTSQAVKILIAYRPTFYDRFFTSSAERMRLVSLKISQIYNDRHLLPLARDLKQSKIKAAVMTYESHNVLLFNRSRIDWVIEKAYPEFYQRAIPQKKQNEFVFMKLLLDFSHAPKENQSLIDEIRVRFEGKMQQIKESKIRILSKKEVAYLLIQNVLLNKPLNNKDSILNSYTPSLYDILFLTSEQRKEKIANEIRKMVEHFCALDVPFKQRLTYLADSIDDKKNVDFDADDLHLAKEYTTDSLLSQRSSSSSAHQKFQQYFDSGQNEMPFSKDNKAVSSIDHRANQEEILTGHPVAERMNSVSCSDLAAPDRINHAIEATVLESMSIVAQKNKQEDILNDQQPPFATVLKKEPLEHRNDACKTEKRVDSLLRVQLPRKRKKRKTTI